MCQACGVTQCKAQPNTLRLYRNWNDLASHCDEEVIVRFVNQLATITPEWEKLRDREGQRKAYHKKYQEKKKQLVAVAKRVLDPDELAELARQAEERAAELMEEEELEGEEQGDE